jgi:hypothetical protein
MPERRKVLFLKILQKSFVFLQKSGDNVRSEGKISLQFIGFQELFAGFPGRICQCGLIVP